MKAAKRCTPNRGRKLRIPITPAILNAVADRTIDWNDGFDVACTLTGALCLYGLFRPGQFTSNKSSPDDRDHRAGTRRGFWNLVQPDDIEFFHERLSVLLAAVKKHDDPIDRDVDWDSAGLIWDLVEAHEALNRPRDAPPGSPYIGYRDESGTFRSIRKGSFNTFIRIRLRRLFPEEVLSEEDLRRFSGHCFRIAGACLMAMHGADLTTIMHTGCWTEEKSINPYLRSFTYSEGATRDLIEGVQNKDLDNLKRLSGLLRELEAYLTL